jgi:hypothetical protein
MGIVLVAALAANRRSSVRCLSPQVRLLSGTRQAWTITNSESSALAIVCILDRLPFNWPPLGSFRNAFIVVSDPQHCNVGLRVANLLRKRSCIVGVTTPILWVIDAGRIEIAHAAIRQPSTSHSTEDRSPSPGTLKGERQSSRHGPTYRRVDVFWIVSHPFLDN